MKEIIVNGKPLPIHFGMKAILEFTKIQEIDFHDAVTTTESFSNIESVVTLATSGLNEGARRCRPAHGDNSSDNNKRYSVDDIWDMFDDNPELIMQVSEIFMESIVPLMDKLGELNSKNAQPTATENTNE